MKQPYFGWPRWRYKLPNGETGTVDINIVTGSYHADEGFARYLIRKEKKSKRLPSGTEVYPDYPPS